MTIFYYFSYQAIVNSWICYFIWFQSLAKLKEEFLGHKNGGSSPDVSTLSIPHMSNMASQTDLRGEVIISWITYSGIYYSLSLFKTIIWVKKLKLFCFYFVIQKHWMRHNHRNSLNQSTRTNYYRLIDWLVFNASL
jgi:hypothetical protein